MFKAYSEKKSMGRVMQKFMEQPVEMTGRNPGVPGRFPDSKWTIEI